ncbi:hypothetical protein [Amycolatopsis rubida]|uniref:Uncharacterized protein n=1 Tax=Amycolatopsis rubida TaxID=112413 RepID=A0A1I5X8A0_9PSEU|nr:hypothetical protein [Amycolatopsis rubida]SFQ28200.1 hypothetical protein SAMN05421854_11093 [Amycolatopsis rubida]
MDDPTVRPDDLARGARPPRPSPDRIAGAMWKRDDFAAFWPCSPASVPSIATRYGVKRIGRDDETGQATYRAEDVVAARGSLTGQGSRTDIRDNNLARETRPHYLLGRAVGALDLICRHHPACDPARYRGKTAADKIQETGGQLTLISLQDIAHDLATTSKAPPSRPALDRLARQVIDELLPKVEHLSGRPTLEQQRLFFLGFHNQESALLAAERAERG